MKRLVKSALNNNLKSQFAAPPNEASKWPTFEPINTFKSYISLTVLLLLVSISPNVLATPVNFNTSVSCDVGQGTVTFGGTSIPSASCSEQMIDTNSDPAIGIAAEASANGRFGIKGFGFRTSMTVGAANVSGGTYFASSMIEGDLFGSFTVDALGTSATPVQGGSLLVQIFAQGALLTAQDGSGGVSDIDLIYDVSVGGIPYNRTFNAGGVKNFEFIAQNDTFTVPWQNGVPVIVDMRASSLGIVTTFGEGGATARADFQNSLDWGGILAVYDEKGNPVESFTALGEDGTDWSTPAAVVPLPAAAWLFMSGLIGLLLKGRRVRQSVA